jgi:ATP-dependent protease ClpP protease subunit
VKWHRQNAILRFIAEGGTMPTPNQPLKWYEIKARSVPTGGIGGGPDAAARTAEIFIYGNIGDRWDENGVIAADLVREIAALDVATITVRINSFGGSVPDGLAIYNALQRHPATIDMQIDGVAISCAGYIAMAGDTVTMAENALLMIHAPWTFSMGNSADLRDQADMLDKYASAMSTSYATQSGKSPDECLSLLTDGKDHWYTADEALAEGFCSAVGPAVAVAASVANSFNLTRFSAPHKPTAAAVTHQEKIMPNPNPAAPAATSTAPAVVAAGAPAAFVRNNEQSAQILAAFKPFATQTGVSDLQTAILADSSVTVEAAGARLLAHLGKDTTPATPAGAFPRIEMGESETDKVRGAIVQSVLARAGVRDASGAAIRVDASNPFRGYKLLDIARASLDRAGIKSAGMNQMDIVAAAFTQTTSDFPILLENVMHKTLQTAYAVAPLTWNRFCKVGSVSDFRAHPRYRTGSFGSLDSLSETGEFKNKTIPDGEKSSITADTKGNIINLSRQAIINDDLGAFVGLAGDLGRAAARTVEVAVYALLAQNSGLGPTMTDTYTLFHANHGNLTTSAALTMAAIDLDRVAMASQTGVGGNDYLDLRPAVLLVPLALGGTARTVNDSVYDPDTANKLQKPNMVKGLFRDVVDTPRFTGNRRYLFADPNEAPVIEVAFLDGAQEPYLEIQQGFDTDGARYKVRLDYGIAAIDYRGAVTNAGG